MLEKPALPDDLILIAIREQYRLEPSELTFLPIGYDVNTAVYCLVTTPGTAYFLKLKRGPFNPSSVTIPHQLADQGAKAIITPLMTHQDRLWGSLGEYTLVLYPFIEGQDGYHLALTDRQWLESGATVKAIHTTQLPLELRKQLPQEDYSPHWRTALRQFQAQVEVALTGSKVFNTSSAISPPDMKSSWLIKYSPPMGNNLGYNEPANQPAPQRDDQQD